MNATQLARLYSRAHNAMRDIDALHPQEAFDELLKVLAIVQERETRAPEHLARTSAAQRHAAASQLRAEFGRLVAAAGPGEWTDHAIHLSDKALLSVFGILEPVRFSTLAVDVRSAAFREYLSPEARRALGIYLTPDAVVRMMVRVVRPATRATVYDLACGSGTFLLETLAWWNDTGHPSGHGRLIGSDKSRRMVHLAKLNLPNRLGISFEGFVHDAFEPAMPDTVHATGGVDVIFTNPPFGVTASAELWNERTAKELGAKASLQGTLPSEVLFTKRSIEALRPGGTLAIVLPRSVITNARLAAVRDQLGEMGYVYAAVALPPETFATTGTQTTTWAVFIRKYEQGEDRHTPVTIAYAKIDNVGYDTTGRHRDGSQLEDLAEGMHESLTSGQASGMVQLLQAVPKCLSFSELARLTADRSTEVSRLCLADLADLVGTGRTPGRSAYSESGVFILKVGNLTGRGIDWEPRERNFVPVDLLKRASISALLLERGDVVLTSSAHTPKYIAKKVDVIGSIPAFVGGRAIFVGEIIRIRCKSGVNPYRLAAYLRSPLAMAMIQDMVRGQTAHLMPDDLQKLPVPEVVVTGSDRIDEIACLIQQEADEAEQMSERAHALCRLLDSTFSTDGPEGQ